MTSILPRISAEFETLDELTMRGRVFPASQRGPAMIMSPGQRGIINLVFDPRGLGASDGHPVPAPSDTKLALWGLSLGSNVPHAATAFDKRVTATIAIVPLIDSTGIPEKRQPILELAIHDRASRLDSEDPMRLSYVNKDETQGDSHFGDDDIILNKQLDFLKRGLDLGGLSDEYYIHPVNGFKAVAIFPIEVSTGSGDAQPGHRGHSTGGANARTDR
ncbi:unnamed protein product [Penicillium camemberti]|uniref:Str. FM013 n=1 Tax=Penicillium camemberti (strain FM 013) TaxID=1429867 RepID=A0A0G4PNT0_PENC3|nr:unnamed protein product [Penicillium camemberti]